jgi:CPA2 family monovalent cation:H+ antiporter-2
VALDIDAGLVARFRAAGASVFFGDASRPDMLRKLGVERAAALVVTMDSPTAAERVVAVARRHWPELAICARAHDVDHAMRLIASGASHVVPEATEASLQLGELVLMAAGVPEPAARHVVEARRQAEQAAVDESRRDEPG